MQYDSSSTPPIRPRPNRTRLIRMSSGQTTKTASVSSNGNMPHTAVRDISILPTASHPAVTTDPGVTTDANKYDIARDRARTSQRRTDDPFEDISNLSTVHLMQLSGMMQAVRLPRPTPSNGNQQKPTLPPDDDGYWPFGIQQTGVIPVANLYGREPFGRTLPTTPIVTPAMTAPAAKKQPAWKAFIGSPIVKGTIGLLIGVALLLLVSRFVNFPLTFQILRQHLTTPQGIMLALLAGVAFLGAFAVRGVRWKLFLHPIVGNRVSVFKTIQLFLVSIFLNFLLPIQGGEVAKCLMLKRISGTPVSRTLPTVAMDRSLDLLPALFIIVILPLLGIQMDIRLWLVLGVVAGLLTGLIFFVTIAAWKRDVAIKLLQKMLGLFPKSISGKIEGFATGFVDSLLAGASRPRVFILALLLTCVAVSCDGLFAMLAFWTIGYPIPFGTAIFGYTVFNMFFILPTPPGQVGSNEAVGLLVFSGLLHLPGNEVLAMFVFSHPWAALLMCTAGLICLGALGLTISSAMKVHSPEEESQPSKPKPTLAHA